MYPCKLAKGMLQAFNKDRHGGGRGLLGWVRPETYVAVYVV